MLFRPCHYSENTLLHLRLETDYASFPSFSNLIDSISLMNVKLNVNCI